MAVRKNVKTLSSAERGAFVAALKQLKAAPSQFNPPTAGRYDDYVYTHMQAMILLEIRDRTKPVRNGNWIMTGDMRMPMWAHRCPAFLPWHREFLRQFERDLQNISGSPSLGIPYWDWSADQSPTELPWTDDFLGGDGNDGPVNSGPFAGKPNWELTLSEDSVDHLVRGFGRDTQYGPRLPTIAEVAATIRATIYDAPPWSDDEQTETFRDELEGFYVPQNTGVIVGMHNLVHLWVGGTQGSMLPSTSPNDPAFFLHHCFIDRLWAVWQRQNPNAVFYLPSTPLPQDPGQSLNEPMIFYDSNLSSTPPWSDPSARPANLIDHRTLGYVYDDDPPAINLDSAIAATRQLSERPPSPETIVTDPLKLRRRRINPRDHFRLRLKEIEEFPFSS